MSDNDRQHRVECFRRLAADMNLTASVGLGGVAYVVSISGGEYSLSGGFLIGLFAVACFASYLKLWWDHRQDQKESQLIDELKEDLENE